MHTMIRTSRLSRRLSPSSGFVLATSLFGALCVGAMTLPDSGNAADNPVPVVAQAIPGTMALAALPAEPALSQMDAAELESAEPAIPVVATEQERLAELAPTLDREVLRLALAARDSAVRQGEASRDNLLTVIDYSLPSTEERLWVFDTRAEKLLFHELVAHGKNTGDNYARSFSNRNESLQTSLGTFVTAGTYQGGNGYSLRLKGLDAGYNDNAMMRAIVMHGAPYVSQEFARQQGRIGRSWGCPALSREAAPKVIDTIKGGSVIFSYYPDEGWLQAASYLGGTDVTGAVRAAR
jgi:hypothetical protein